jgi:menaquinone-dependent protoporphyrinogen oxidase
LIETHKEKIMSPINRRTFLIRAGIGLGAAGAACCGLSTAALRTPVDPTASESLLPEGNPMNQKILVTYASRAGSTMEVAQTVAKELVDRGFSVDVRPIKQVTSLNGYTGVVVGSAIRMSTWLPEASKFVETHKDTLASLPTAFFCVHLMNIGDDEASRKARLAYLEPVRKLVTPKSEACFAGVGDMSKVSFLDGLISRLVKSPEGDFRDWDAIRTWSQAILN